MHARWTRPAARDSALRGRAAEAAAAVVAGSNPAYPVTARLGLTRENAMILVIDEAGSMTQAYDIDDDIIAAIDDGVMDAVRFHDGNFQRHDGVGEWIALANPVASGDS